MDYLTVALSKGRIGEEAHKIFKRAGIGDALDLSSRKLIFKDDVNKICYISVKPSDVVTYVESGVTDLGIVGKDTILESDGDIYELLDLGFGKCKFSIAGKKGEKVYRKDEVLRVATKYPKITERYFEQKQQKIEIFKLNGSVELAPLVGLSDVIVDIVETGNTLRANGLEVIEDVIEVSARLIANKVSYRFKHDRIKEITNLLTDNVGEKND